MSRDSKEVQPRSGFFRRVRGALTRPSTRWGAGILLAAGIVVGAAGWEGYHMVVAKTGTLEFCISCHEMEAYVYPDYAESSHYSNASGVRAACADCHVPNSLGPKTYAKMRATVRELPNHFLGKIDTQAKFDAHKLEMAERVWAYMQSNNSRECRDCHSYAAMSEELQDRIARRRHSIEYREQTGRTCIDCHKGIAHALPENM